MLRSDLLPEPGSDFVKNLNFLIFTFQSNKVQNIHCFCSFDKGMNLEISLDSCICV